MSKYQELRKINVNVHIEKKNNLSYLSWAWAVDILLENDAMATWEYQEPKLFGETMMVFCTVTAFDKKMTAQLPVMDYRNKAIPNPDAFAVNTAMQRCLAKAIALHGLGLYIYAGEDLPEDDTKGKGTPKDTPEHKPISKQPNAPLGNIESSKSPLAGALDGFNTEEIEKLKETTAEIVNFGVHGLWDDAFIVYDNIPNNDEKTAIWSLLQPNSSIRSKLKTVIEEKRKSK